MGLDIKMMKGTVAATQSLPLSLSQFQLSISSSICPLWLSPFRLWTLFHPWTHSLAISCVSAVFLHSSRTPQVALLSTPCEPHKALHTVMSLLLRDYFSHWNLRCYQEALCWAFQCTALCLKNHILWLNRVLLWPLLELNFMLGTLTYSKRVEYILPQRLSKCKIVSKSYWKVRNHASRPRGWNESWLKSL